MTNSTMTKYDFTEVINLYNDTLAPLHKQYISEGNQGGKVRGTVGKLYETIAHMICLLVNPELEVKHNDYINIASRSGRYFKKTQVDLHVYLRDELVLIIECKTYLDSSMLDRAISEFTKIRTHHAITSDKVLPCAVFTGQQCVNEESFNFLHEEEPFDMFVTNKTPNRSSKLPIFQTLDPLNVNVLTQFATYVDNIVNNS
tara:strand:+ start:324 stop:926 length:603 start_codon:yes stop_codon:yes gene_type:complete